MVSLSKLKISKSVYILKNLRRDFSLREKKIQEMEGRKIAGTRFREEEKRI